MGQAISVIRDAVKLMEERDKKVADDALNALIAMAKVQQELFYTQIKSPNFDTLLIPIHKIISNQSVIRCKVQEKNTMADTINGFKNLISGDVAKGFTTLLDRILDVLLGSFSANSSTTSTYMICVGDLGAITRVDLHFFCYNYSSEAIQKITENILAVSIVVSSVKVDDLDANTLRAIVQNCYGDSSVQAQQDIYKQLRTALDDSKKLQANYMQRQLGDIIELDVAQVNGNIDPIDTKTETKVAMNFSVDLPTGTAPPNISPLETWVTGWLNKSFESASSIEIRSIINSDAGPRVTCNTTVTGNSKLVTETKVRQELYSCLDSLMHNPFYPIPVIGFAIKLPDKTYQVGVRRLARKIQA